MAATVQYLSDLHLEAGNQYLTFDFPAAAPYLLLAGDVGSLANYDDYLVFIRRQTKRFAGVFLVLGNHEFHGLDYNSTLISARQLETEPSLNGRLRVLHRSRLDVAGTDITILGCTLWTKIPHGAKTAVEGRVKDFGHIAGWTVDKHNTAHNEDVEWLKRMLLEVPEGRRVVIATHHAPAVEGTSETRHRGSPWASAFATGLLEEGGWGRVHRWVFGHTHFSTDGEVRGVRISSNQRGYALPGGSVKEGFDTARVLC